MTLLRHFHILCHLTVHFHVEVQSLVLLGDPSRSAHAKPKFLSFRLKGTAVGWNESGLLELLETHTETIGIRLQGILKNCMICSTRGDYTFYSRYR